ncbi:globin domain-containing protein [Acinetobacter faecalis]|uniref:globin domain-containing protein n=1 Tax=Acinetobacter faecalis TaxID=2665161 RepID=UPI002A91F955|nr:globin domain-containing protein [Acinetobacter faecalis]MDY6449317.1 globin domain-containing protein [Acinetobacter faecalis]MDY6467913.1 globin domain-containing protein [Acinetobacter faecalis]
MNPQYIELVKSTVPVLRENGVALTSYFYNRMLTNNPELKNTFNLDHQSTGRQPRALAAAVLAYAENIENPSVLAKAIEHIATKHVSLDIQPDQYSIVGENLLHSISEVLDVPMDSDLIAAWKEAYLQLAEILINAEKQKFDNLAAKQGGWSGWRSFDITAIESNENGKTFTIKATDGNDVVSAEAGQYVSVKVKVPNHELQQPQQFKFADAQENNEFKFAVKAEENGTEFSVANILLESYNVGDTVQVTAPL